MGQLDRARRTRGQYEPQDESAAHRSRLEDVRRPNCDLRHWTNRSRRNTTLDLTVKKVSPNLCTIALTTRSKGVIKVTTVLIDQLRQAGLLDVKDLHLTDKGRDWLRQLEEFETKEIAEDWAADFVSSFSAISR